MRLHATLGHELLQTMPELPDDVLDIVLHHHEYLDGTGYPHGLKGDQISDLSRLITIADVYAALIEQRSYKPALPGGAGLSRSCRRWDRNSTLRWFANSRRCLASSDRSLDHDDFGSIDPKS